MSTPANQQTEVVSDAAIDALRNHQERCRELLEITPTLTEPEELQLALKYAKQYEARSTRDGDYIRIGCFKYPPRREELRWQRTREVIRRVRPGVDEDPRYLAMLAREAASLEIVISQAHTDSPNPKMLALCNHVLLGTTASLDVNASCEEKAGSAVVLLRYGLIDFFYQAAKSVVLSWRPLEPRPGTSGGLGVSIADIEQVLDKTPHLLELLSETLHAYMFEGRPRVVGYAPPPAEHVPALELLTTFTERFVIAHEYGHALWQELNPNYARPAGISECADEFNADFFALFFTIMSAGALDLVPPNVALQGGFFTLYALEIIRKTLDLIRFGSVQEDKGTETHPPNQQRIEFLKKLYKKQHFENDKKYDLDIEGALIPGTTLDFLWSRIQHQFVEAKQQGKSLHPIWN